MPDSLFWLQLFVVVYGGYIHKPVQWRRAACWGLLKVSIIFDLHFPSPPLPCALAQDLIFIHALNKNLLSIYLSPATILRSGDTEIKRTPAL